MVWNKGKTGIYSEETLRKLREARKGTHHSEETKKKMSEKRRGRPKSEEHKRKISEAHKGIGVSLEAREKISKSKKGKKLSVETRRKMSDSYKRHLLDGVFNQRPTLPEKVFMQLCKKYNLPYKYVGNGKFWIENINPDFIECNGKKIAVEIFGDYWHSPLLSQVPYKRTYQGRMETLEKYGWKCIIIWGSELKNGVGEGELVARLRGR